MSAAAPQSVPKVRSGFRSLAGRAATWGLIPYVFVAAMLALLQRKLMYLPLREAVPAVTTGLPDGQIHDVTLQTHDGLMLHGWLALADDAPRDRQSISSDNRPLILYFAGNGGHRGYRLKEIRQFLGLGCHVLYFDYRGYAENPGHPTEAELARDADRAWQFATQELGVSPGRIVLWGESLGGGVAVRLAADLSDQGKLPRGLILRGTFTSMTDTAAWHYPWLPVRWLLLDRYPSIDHIPRVACPLLVLHGQQDRIVPFEMGQRLFAAAPERSRSGVPKTFVSLPAAGHNDVMYVAADEVGEAVRGFLGQIGEP